MQDAGSFAAELAQRLGCQTEEIVESTEGFADLLLRGEPLPEYDQITEITSSYYQELGFTVRDPSANGVIPAHNKETREGILTTITRFDEYIRMTVQTF